MMSKPTLYIVAVILIAFFTLIMVYSNKNDGKMESPLLGIVRNILSRPTPSPTPIPPNAPKTFQFDSSTNLKQELDSINPQVLDSDFE